MRRVIGYVLIGLAVVLVLAAPTLKWVVAPKLEVAPLQCDPSTEYPQLCDNGVIISPSTGVARTLFDQATLSERTNVALTADRRIKPDRDASTAAQTIYDMFLPVTDDSGELVGPTTQARFAFDGHTSVMVDCCDANVDNQPITDFGALMPLKFGFGVKQQDYQYFDTTLGVASTAAYQGTDEIDGVEVYVFKQVIEPTKVDDVDVPGSLVGSKQDTYAAPRYYSNIRTLSVEPTTGVIVKGEEQQLQTLRGPDGTDALTIIDATLTFTPDNVANAAQTASDGKQQLQLVTSTIPLLLLVLGLILLAVGLFLVLGVRDSSPDSA